MSDNPYESPKSDRDLAAASQPCSGYSWVRAAIMVAWLALGAPAGWAASVLLWISGYLNPCCDGERTFFVLMSPMILTGVFGARKHPEVLPPLIAFPLLPGGLLWALAPAPSMTSDGLSQFYINKVYPCLIVPAAILGGIIAVVSVKLRAGNRDANRR